MNWCSSKCGPDFPRLLLVFMSEKAFTSYLCQKKLSLVFMPQKVKISKYTKCDFLWRCEVPYQFILIHFNSHICTC